MSLGNVVRIACGLWGIAELLLAIAQRAQTTGAQRKDRGSLLLLWIVITLALVFGMRFRSEPAGLIPLSPLLLAVIGLMIAACGIAMRVAAVATLKRSFTVDVAIRSDQQLIRSGLYRYVRHPSYTGLLVAVAGFGIGFGNWITLATFVIPIFFALVYRISVEESVLTAAFGDAYREYAKTTSRLIPGIY